MLHSIAQGLQRHVARRLSRRIVAVSLLLLLAVQAAGFMATRASVERNARAGLAAELEVGERVWRRLLDQRSEALVQAARVLAADYGFRSALGPQGDDETLVSALENFGERIGAGVTAWVEAGGGVRALHDSDGGLGDGEEISRVAAALAGGRIDRKVGQVQGRPVQFVAVPVRAPVLLGWLVMGFPVDQGMLEDMRALSGLELALLASPQQGPQRVLAATAGVAEHPAALLAARQNTQIGEQTLLLRRVVLAEPAAAREEAAAEVLLLRSVDEAVARYAQLQAVMALITLAGVGFFAWGSSFTARRIVTPLRNLVRASESLGRGDYESPVNDVAREDEVGELARAFDRMRGNLAAHEQEIRTLAYWDRLTGLPNRAQFRDRLATAIEAALAQAAAGEPTPPLTVVMLDLDRFKHVNDVLGYAFGDSLLQAVGQRLQAQPALAGTLVARLSGDEFALLLPGSDAARGLAMAERVALAFEQPISLQDHTVDLAAGFGIASFPLHASDADTLMSRAEIAMYGAKRKTASALVYDPAIDAGSAQTLSLLSELRRAVDGGELRLYLQPKIALAGDRLCGAEALVRWQHPRRGLVPPMQFIPFAEQTGFVRQLTLWIFEEAARQWPALQALGLQRVSVNLSTRDLLDQDLLAKLQQCLQRHGAKAEAFCLEITESAIMDEPQRALAMLQALHQAGFKLSIDDFGTGYSSMAYLKQLPVDELKIDKSFVMGMADDAKDTQIVRSTIDLAHHLGLSVVAEGVESQPIMDALRALGCDEAQGYHMCKPLPAAEMPGFAERWAARRASLLLPA